jgi:type II secretory pathway pseudopilin PulG
MHDRGGYTFLIVLIMMTILAIGLLVAVPVWRTEVQREAEEELIFRGNQYVEAVRRFQAKTPGAFPKTIEDLLKGRFLRRAFPDPMTTDGKWDLILLPGTESSSAARAPRDGSGNGGQTAASAKVFVVPWGSLSSIPNARIIGVVSRSTQSSIRIYQDNETYDTWLFYYGQTASAHPEIVHIGRPEK